MEKEDLDEEHHFSIEDMAHKEQDIEKGPLDPDQVIWVSTQYVPYYESTSEEHFHLSTGA